MSESDPLHNASTTQWSAFMECLLLINLSFSLFFTCSAVDNIPVNTSLKDGDTIISAAGNFELGFFTPGGGGSINSTTNRYLAIWYKKVSIFTTVWVANREFPVADTSGLLRLNPDGILTLLSSSSSNYIIWASISSRSVRNPVAQLLDTGNFVIRDKNDENSYNYVWQSFDYPGDTLLPGMKFGKDLVTGLDRQLTPWKSLNDPSPGNFTSLMDTVGYPQFVIKMGSDIQFRLGPWNGIRFSGYPSMRPVSVYTYEFVMNEMEIYFEYDMVNRSLFLRNVISPSGDVRLLYWMDRTQSWLFYITTLLDNCDRYGLCGPHGSCDADSSPACSCLDGFEPSIPLQWNVKDWSGGCKRKISLDCGDGEGFRKYSGLKLPDTESSWSDQNMNLEECEKSCKSNCNCTAYTNLDIRGSGSGCLQWFGDLIDIRTYTYNGQDIYIRMASSELVSPATYTATQSRSKRNEGNILKVILPLVFGVVLVGAGLTLYAWRKKKILPLRKAGKRGNYTEQDYRDDNNNDDQLPLFGLFTLVNATNNFSIENKLGEGGFGVVYKGVMEDGQEIAVKRLSKTSSQGLVEFKNEVICISKLQHRNLVKLKGCCIQGDEKMLVYEFMPNNSLDSLLFDESKGMILDWPKRFHIIKGIARGLLYLHHDSRLRIIHRDLKASNILLDHEMNPKISDFGLARSFGGNETGANTNRVVGTYGYMSPEYAADGLYSVKSDVFSFGVIVIEIVSGKKNRGFFHLDQLHNLPGHAWRLYKEGRALELMDASLGDSWCEHEILRSIQVGLLCAQQHIEDRPTMSSVVTMLDSEIALPQPKHPGFFTGKGTVEAESSSSSSAPLSVNQITITQLAAR